MESKLVQHNMLTHKSEEVILPVSKNTLLDWKDKFNKQSPAHINYTIEEKK